MYDRYQALIFDCDGTLVDSLHAHYTAWTRIRYWFSMIGLPT